MTTSLSKIWKNTDGCSEQYICDSALYLMSVLSQCYSVIIDHGTLRMLSWLKFWLLQAFRTCRVNFIWSVFYVWQSGCYLRMFCIRQYVLCIHLVRNGSFVPPFIPNIQMSIYIGLFMIIVLNVCVSGDDVLNDLRIKFLYQFGSIRICFVKFLLVLDRSSMFKLFWVIDILAGFNHFYMVITRILEGLGWIFTETPLWQLYHGNLYYINIHKLRTWEWLYSVV